MNFSDNVRIRSTPDTQRLGFAGKRGVVSGFTTPSVTGVDVIGSPHDNYAIAVMIEDGTIDDAWFTEDLVEFVDHAPGTEIRIGNVKAVRMADGSWEEARVDGTPLSKPESPLQKKWWQFW